jgi:hypothetical protein
MLLPFSKGHDKTTSEIKALQVQVFVVPELYPIRRIENQLLATFKIGQILIEVLRITQMPDRFLVSMMPQR